MLPLLRDIIDAMAVSHATLSSVNRAKLHYNLDGEPTFYAGRRSATFRISIDGRCYALKCYTSTPTNVAEVCRVLSCDHSDLIIAPQFLPNELYISGRIYRGYIDALLYPWAEGGSLDFLWRKAAFNHDVATLRTLADSFTRLALDLLGSEWRHGDLKPDNIIVGSGGTMRLIDIDALYHPTLSWAGEVGTSGFVHPARGCAYDSHIDDYSIALICTILYALALNPRLAALYPSAPMLISPAEAVEGRSEALTEIKALFPKGTPLHALASSLEQNNHKIETLKELLLCITQI